MTFILRTLGFVQSQPVVQQSAEVPPIAPAAPTINSASTIASAEPAQSQGMVRSFISHLNVFSRTPALSPYEQAIKDLTKSIKRTKSEISENEQNKYLSELMKQPVYTHCLNLVDLLLRDNSSGTALQEKMDNPLENIIKVVRDRIDPEDKRVLSSDQRLHLTSLLDCAFFQTIVQLKGEELRGKLDTLGFGDKTKEAVEYLNSQISRPGYLMTALLLQNIYKSPEYIEKYMWQSAFGSPEEVLRDMDQPSLELIRFAQSRGLCDASTYEVPRKALFQEILKAGDTGMSSVAAKLANLGRIYDTIALVPRTEEMRLKVTAIPPAAPQPDVKTVKKASIPEEKKEKFEEKKKLIVPSVSQQMAFEFPRAIEARQPVKLEIVEGPLWFYTIPIELRPVIYQNIRDGVWGPVEIRVHTHFIKEDRPTSNQDAESKLSRRLQEATTLLEDTKRKIKQPADKIIFGFRLKQMEEPQLKVLAEEFLKTASQFTLFKRDKFFYSIYELATKKGIDTKEAGWAEKHALDNIEIFVDALTQYNQNYLN